MIGLARPDEKMYLVRGASLPDTDGSLLNAIRNDPSSDGQAFSTRLSADVISWIDFGKPSSTEGSDGTQIKANPDYFWSTNMESIQIGEDTKKTYGFSNEAKQGEYVSGGVYTILDFASKDIFISKLWFESFVSKLASVANAKTTYKSGLLTASCNKSWPDLYLAIDGGY